MFARIKHWLGLDYYVSPLDAFLMALKTKATVSEQQEVEKHRRIFKARDEAIVPRKKPAAWDAF